MPLHVLALTPPAHGHVNPLLPIAAELVRRGVRVTIPLPDPFRPQVEAAGAAFVSLGEMPPMPSMTPGLDPAQRAEIMNGFRARVGAWTEASLAAVEADPPDVLLYDAMLQLFGIDLPQRVAVSRVAYCPSFAFPDGSTPRQFFEQMAAASPTGTAMPGLPGGPAGLSLLGEAAFRSEPLTLVTIPRFWQPEADRFDGRYRFVGPSLRTEPAGDFPLPAADGRPRVFVSLGTVASDKPDFYRAVFAALAGRDWQAVVSTGRADPALLGAAPANVVAAPHVPQLRVLRQSDVFVSHGGMNSTMEALSLGVPLVVVPQMADQFMNAQRVAELGIGRSLAGVEPTPEALVAAIEAVLADAAARDRLAALRPEVTAGGGAVAAAEAIEELAAVPAGR